MTTTWYEKKIHKYTHIQSIQRTEERREKKLMHETVGWRRLKREEKKKTKNQICELNKTREKYQSEERVYVSERTKKKPKRKRNI